MYYSTKTYGHEVGLSACFRQWRAPSHCAYLHGYALSVKLTFSASKLNANNWVVDFDGLKQVKAYLQEMFDHTLMVAEDDPQRQTFEHLGCLDVARVIIVPNTGCEAFAKIIHESVTLWMQTRPDLVDRCSLESVEVAEHGANSAIYSPL